MTDGDDRRLEVSNAESTCLDDTVEAYEAEGLTVLYEAANPLAWIESSVAYPIEEAA